MDDDLEARKSVLNQTWELRGQSYSALMAISKKAEAIQKEISILKAKEEGDHTALKALQVTLHRLDVESIEETRRYLDLLDDLDIEEKQFNAYLTARRRTDRPNREPSPEIVSFEGDVFKLYLL
jgi:hypothetical protein